MSACCVEVCSVNSCPSAKPKSTVRKFAVRSSMRLTMPLAANLVSSGSDRIFPRAGSIKGFSLMLKVSHKQSLRDLTQIKQFAFAHNYSAVLAVTGRCHGKGWDSSKSQKT
jgi:hypothetical protein